MAKEPPIGDAIGGKGAEAGHERPALGVVREISAVTAAVVVYVGRVVLAVVGVVGADEDVEPLRRRVADFTADLPARPAIERARLIGIVVVEPVVARADVGVEALGEAVLERAAEPEVARVAPVAAAVAEGDVVDRVHQDETLVEHERPPLLTLRRRVPAEEDRLAVVVVAILVGMAAAEVAVVGVVASPLQVPALGLVVEREARVDRPDHVIRPVFVAGDVAVVGGGERHVRLECKPLPDLDALGAVHHLCLRRRNGDKGGGERHSMLCSDVHFSLA